MDDRKPDRGYSIARAPNNTSFSSVLGYEKRKRLSRKVLRKFTFSYTNISESRKNSIENFYLDRGGDFETFKLDLAHFGLSGTANVKFSESLDINHVISGDNTDIFNISLILTEVA
jgi:hypothetical protein